MSKVFNVAAVCRPDAHYMVNIDDRLKEIKKLVDDGMYFTINKARQYGKTTTLLALNRYLRGDYCVVSMDFQTFGAGQFKDENVFARSFGRSFLRSLKRSNSPSSQKLDAAIQKLSRSMEEQREDFMLRMLFEHLSDLCAAADKPVVLMIDEVDSATNNQVFLDFLAQLRAYYIGRDMQPTFWSVILAGVYDVKNLVRKLRPDEDHKVNTPWNIAADFRVDMSFPKNGIEGMLWEYESDYHTGMDVEQMANLLFDYTSGYPYFVSRLCKLMDEEISLQDGFRSKGVAWTRRGFNEAVKMLLTEKNTLFESLSEKLTSWPKLAQMLRMLLFTGRSIVYNFYEPATNIATMFGFVKNQNGTLAVANRIFDTWLYNLFLSTAEMQELDIYKASLQDKNQFVVDGYLNMQLILEKFVMHFHDLYGDSDEAFIEDEGRKYFLLYLRPIINGIGNYYIESQTRDLRRTDVIVDYRGEQYIIELKIWRGEEYNHRGEAQILDYLDSYHLKKGYMVSFIFNKKKEIGVKELVIGGKTLIEAVA